MRQGSSSPRNAAAAHLQAVVEEPGHRHRWPGHGVHHLPGRSGGDPGQVKFEQADDLSKIQGRFRTKLTLASADVQEVIQRRLLPRPRRGRRS